MARLRRPQIGNTRRRKRRGRSSSWAWLRPLLLVALLVLVWQGFVMLRPPPSGDTVSLSVLPCDAGWGRGSCAIDGDTLTIGKRRIRLTGFDAPERKGACERESELAREATRKLARWINRGPFEWDGGDQPPRDRYGRELRSAWRTGADGKVDWLADYMVEAGLAADDGWGSSEKDWCA